VRRLTLVEQKVDSAHRVNNTTGPRIGFSGGDWRRTLSAKFGYHAPTKVLIFFVQMLLAELICMRDDLVIFSLQRPPVLALFHSCCIL
jgi:hypothetical protein